MATGDQIGGHLSDQNVGDELRDGGANQVSGCFYTRTKHVLVSKEEVQVRSLPSLDATFRFGDIFFTFGKALRPMRLAAPTVHCGRRGFLGQVISAN